MKLYILADMEGISGIQIWDQVKKNSPEYEEGRRLMMADINAAVEAALEAGANHIVVCDTHGAGLQIRLREMNPAALYERPNRGRPMPSLDESFDGVILLGHHAMAGTLDGFLDHTMSSASWFEYRLNGKPMGEIGIEAAWAGHYKVPVIAVTGDEAACREATDLLGNVECAVVKWGIGRNIAKCLSLQNAHERVKSAVKKAVSSIGEYKPFCPSLPATVTLTYYRSDMADGMCSRAEIERLDARTIQKTVHSLLDVTWP